jgi:hypothetical protein
LIAGQRRSVHKAVGCKFTPLYFISIRDLNGILAVHCSLLSFLFKLILLHEFTIAAWSIYGYGEKKPASGSEDVRSSTPFAPHQPDVWVSQCGHVFVSYRRGKSRDPQSVVFLNDEGGYIDIPRKETYSDSVDIFNPFLQPLTHLSCKN